MPPILKKTPPSWGIDVQGDHITKQTRNFLDQWRSTISMLDLKVFSRLNMTEAEPTNSVNVVDIILCMRRDGGNQVIGGKAPTYPANEL